MQTESSGTATGLTIGTPFTLASPTTAHYRQLLVDVSALSSGEQVTLQVSAPVLNGGTTQVILSQSFTGVEAAPNTQSDVLAMPEGGTFTLTQVSGTVRSFPWRILITDA